MTTIMTVPRATVPLLFQDGASINPEWYRWVRDISLRVGGVISPTIGEVAAMVNNAGAGFLMSAGDEASDPAFVMGPQGLTGAAGVSIQGAVGEQGEQGEQGPPGPPGTTIAAPKVFTDQSASRAINTTYTNLATISLMVIATVRCAISFVGGTATAQAKMDTSSPPTTIASGIVGIQVGLMGEDNTFQIAFAVNPGAQYRIDTTAVNGTTVLGKWFELTL